MQISVLDIGAATLNLLHATVRDNELSDLAESWRFVRLGEGTLLTGVIAPDAWNSALTGIEALLARSPEDPGQIVTVATSVMRETVNGPAFCKTLHVLYGLNVRVLSAADEAALAFLGVRSALPQAPPQLAVIDLGGGCVNFAFGQVEGSPITATLSLGTMRLLPAFAPEGILSRVDADALAALVRRSMAMNGLRAGRRSAPALAFCSGAARAVRAYATRGTACPGPVGFIDEDALDRAHRELIGAEMTDLVDRGVAADDADVLAIATTLLRTIMETLGADRAMVIDRGLREGVALQHYNRVWANRGRTSPAPLG